MCFFLLFKINFSYENHHSNEFPKNFNPLITILIQVSVASTSLSKLRRIAKDIIIGVKHIVFKAFALVTKKPTYFFESLAKETHRF